MASNLVGTYDNLLQGISQQQVRDRLPGQCTDQLNMIPDPVDGLRDRSPLLYLNRYFQNVPTNSKWHNYTRGDENYITVFHDDGVGNGTAQVTTYDGATRTVNVDARSAAYLAAGTGLYRDKLSTVTAGDVTLICNSEVPTTVLRPSMYSQWADSLVYFRSIVPGRTLTITIRDETGVTVGPFQYTVPTSVSTVAIGVDDIARQTDIQNRLQQQGTDVVCEAVRAILSANAGFNTSFIAAAQGSVLHIQSKFTDQVIETVGGYRRDITVSITDDLGGVAVYAVNRQVTTVGDLPPYAPDDYTVRIKGGVSSDDDFYMKFKNTTLTGFTSEQGNWEECGHPQQDFRLNADDMPQALIREPGGNFRLVPLDVNDDNFGVFWKDRLSGDDNVNPMPNFVGQTISDIGLFQERLFFISGEYITFSETLDYWDFFKKSATTELRTDPINKPANNNEVANLRYAVQHDRDLIVFADNAQFRINGRSPITQNTLAMVVTTAFEADLNVRPVPAGEVIFFPFRTGAFSGIREFFTNRESDSNNARPITAQIKKLISGGIRQMVSSSQEDFLIVQAKDDLQQVFMYNYLWQEGQRVQSAWGRADFCDVLNIEHMFFRQSDLFVMFRDLSDNMHATRISLENSDVEGLTHNIFIDFRLPAVGVNTSIVLPTDYPLPVDQSKLIVIQGEGCPNPGLRIPATFDEGTLTFTLKRDMNGGTVYVGRTYKRSYKPSMPVRRDFNGKYIQPDRFTISEFTVFYDNSGPFTVDVTHPQFDAFSYENSNRIVGLARVGEDNLASSSFSTGIRLPVTDLEVEYSTTSHLPLSFSSLSWKGQFTVRGRRV